MTLTNNAAENGDQTQATAPEVLKNKFSKKTIITGSIIIVLALLVLLAYKYKGLAIAATVNGHPISRISVIKQLEKEGGKNTLTTMINNQLIDDAAKAKGATVSDDQVNSDIDNLKNQFTSQGQSLDSALSQQNMTIDDLRTQFRINDELKKLLADKIQVTDDEINQYVISNKISIPKGQEAAYHDQLKSQMAQQKLDNAAQDYIASLRSAAKINTFVNY